MADRSTEEAIARYEAETELCIECGEPHSAFESIFLREYYCPECRGGEMFTADEIETLRFALDDLLEAIADGDRPEFDADKVKALKAKLTGVTNG